MTGAQLVTVGALKRDGFKVDAEGRDIVRVSKGTDCRMIMANGTQKRSNHTPKVKT